MNKKSTPRLSIVTVVYNGEKYLEGCINSVVSQAYENMEYIIVDGGSTDQTPAIIKRFDKYIDCWISEKDEGIYDAMNKGIDMASGEYIAFLNADDWYEPGALRSVSEFIDAHPDVEFIYGNIMVVGEGRSYLWKGNRGKDHLGESIPHPACFIRTSILKQKPFDLTYKYAADNEMLVRLVRQNIRKRYLDTTIANFRTGGASADFAARLETFRINRNYFGYFHALKVIVKDVINIVLRRIKKAFIR